ncbi:MAG: hypothetical protein RJQ14_25430 [Marinoscillum sp.]
MNLIDNLILNYANEEIPSCTNLVSRSNIRVKEAMDSLRYSFYELFNKVNVGDRVENHRNLAIWGELFNNWSKENYDAQNKPLHLNKPKNEGKGIYVFYENDIPLYTGISRKIIQRLRNHFTGTTHFQATLTCSF